MKNKILGLVLLPLLYVRWAFLLFLPICIYFMITDETVNIDGVIYFILFFWSIWGIIFSVLFGNFEIMTPVTKWLHKSFKVKYTYKKQRNKDTLLSYFLVEINGKEHKLAFLDSWINMYDTEASLMRKILFIWLFEGGKK